MLSKRILFIAIIVAAACAFFPPPTTFGCIPADDGACIAVKPERVQVTTPQIEASTLNRPRLANRAALKRNLTQFVNNKPNAEPPTDNPTAVDVTAPQDTWVHIGPNETLWFEVGDAIKRLSVAVDAHRQPGLALSIYSPEQHDVFSAEEIGRGARENGYDLWWSGAVRENGKWHVKLRNENDFSVPYNMTTRSKTDGGIEYRPNVKYAFGTGVNAPTAPVVKNQPVAPVEPPQMVEPAAVVPQKGADHPGAAQEPNGTTEHIGPGQTLWYKMFTRARLYVWVDTGGQQGIELAIFPPGTSEFWGTKPVGLGSKKQERGKGPLLDGTRARRGDLVRTSDQSNRSLDADHG